MLVKEFPYKECKAEELELDKGEYLLEVWGASGGTYNPSKALGGAGGYARGKLTVKEKTKVFVHVGSQGSNTSRGEGSQGCNGGGYSGSSSGKSGGGATDIRLNNDSLYARIIVAGGRAGVLAMEVVKKEALAAEFQVGMEKLPHLKLEKAPDKAQIQPHAQMEQPHLVQKEHLVKVERIPMLVMKEVVVGTADLLHTLQMEVEEDQATY